MTRPTRVLITGGGGQVASELVGVLRGSRESAAQRHVVFDSSDDEFFVLALAHHELDVTDPLRVSRALEAARPDVVVNLAAYTNVDQAEADVSRCRAVNATAVANLSVRCGELNCHFITVSTDYVFDGEKGSAYVEEDPVHPLNVYGATKVEGEQLLAPHDTLVRTSWVYGDVNRGAVAYMLREARSGGRVAFVNDQIGTPTFSQDLAGALGLLVRERPGGKWHVANSGEMSWYDVARNIGRLSGRGDDFAQPIASDELDPRPTARRPRRSDLSVEKFERAFVPLPSSLEGLARFVERYPS